MSNLFTFFTLYDFTDMCKWFVSKKDCEVFCEDSAVQNRNYCIRLFLSFKLGNDVFQIKRPEGIRSVLPPQFQPFIFFETLHLFYIS